MRALRITTRLIFSLVSAPLAFVGCRCLQEPPKPTIGAEPLLTRDTGPPIGAWSIVGKLGEGRPFGTARVRARRSTFSRAVVWREVAIDIVDLGDIAKKGVIRRVEPPPCAKGPRPFEYTDDPLRLTQVATEWGDGIFFDAGASCGYDLEHDAWIPVPALPASAGAVVTVLKNGDLLVTGGSDWIGALGGHSEPRADATRWVAETNTLVTLPKMSRARMHHAAHRLLDGTVVLLSGKGEPMEAFEPSRNAFRALGVQKAGGATVLTGDGRLLFLETDECHLFDPSPATWSFCAKMPTPRTDFATTTLDSNLVLVSGGYAIADGGFGPALPRAELYDPHVDLWRDVPAMPLAMARHESVKVSDGRVLLLGGVSRGPEGPTVDVAEVLLFTPPKDP